MTSFFGDAFLSLGCFLSSFDFDSFLSSFDFAAFFSGDLDALLYSFKAFFCSFSAALASLFLTLSALLSSTASHLACLAAFLSSLAYNTVSLAALFSSLASLFSSRAASLAFFLANFCCLAISALVGFFSFETDLVVTSILPGDFAYFLASLASLDFDGFLSLFKDLLASVILATEGLAVD